MCMFSFLSDDWGILFIGPLKSAILLSSLEKADLHLILWNLKSRTVLYYIWTYYNHITLQNRLYVKISIECLLHSNIIFFWGKDKQYKLYTLTSPLLLKLSGCVVCFSLPKRTFKIIFSRETDSMQLRVSEFFISPVYLTIAKPLLSAMQYTDRSFGPWVL